MKTVGTARSKARDISSWSSADQARRDAILRSASAHVRHYGYQKTTVADIAKAIPLSTVYLYNFFDSKQAIGEAVCTRILSDLISELDQSVQQIASPSECIVFIYEYLADASIKMFREDRKIHDLVALSFHEHWTSPAAYNAALLTTLKNVILRGREGGEFERKTPLDETCETVRYTTETFFHPILLEQNPRDLIDEALAVAQLVLRSLLR
jgi:AcrR family transcriptional regulator